MFQPIDIKGLKALDKYTVQVPCHSPFATLPEVLSVPCYFHVIPVGYDVHHPVGTGAFKYKSFTPGQLQHVRQESKLLANGLPHVDNLVITDIAAESSQVTPSWPASWTLIDDLSAASMSTVTGGGKKILLSDSYGHNPFFMRTDVAPFSDVRVRQAMRLILTVSRCLTSSLRATALLGTTFSVTQVLSTTTRSRNASRISRRQSPCSRRPAREPRPHPSCHRHRSGCDISAQLFAQQAKAAGVTVNIPQILRRIGTTNTSNGPSR